MVSWLIKIKEFVTRPYYAYKEKQFFKKRMAELRKKDPFIYK